MTINTLFNINDKVIVTPKSASAWDKKIYVVGKIEYNSEDETVYYCLNDVYPANLINAVLRKGFFLKMKESALQAATVELVTQLFDTTAAAEKAALFAQLGE